MTKAPVCSARARLSTPVRPLPRRDCRRAHAFYPGAVALILGVLAATATGQSNPAEGSTPYPAGGYLDWVFYDELPASEQRRISGQCPGSFIDPWQSPELSAEQTSIAADRTSGTLNGRVTLNGNVTITRNVLALYADTADVQLAEETFALPAGGIIRQPDTGVIAGRVNAQGERGTYQLYDARFTLHQANLHGDARILDQEDNVFNLSDTWVTRCAPGAFGWSLHARELTVDRNTEFATGYHGTLRVGPVPVAYTPYFRFNLNRQRSTGFLRPTISYYSSYDQWRLSTPFYWAIAPNADATTTVDWMLTGDPDLGAPQTAHIGQEARYLNRYFRADALGGVYPGWDDPNTDEAQWGLDFTITSRNTPIDWSVDYRNSSAYDYFPEFYGDSATATHTNTLALGYRVAPTNTRLTGRLQNQSIYPGATRNQVRDGLAYVEQPGLHVRQPIPSPGRWDTQVLVDAERRRKPEPEIAALSPDQFDPLLGLRNRNRVVVSRTDRWNNWTLSQRYTGDHTSYVFPDYEQRTGTEHPAEGYNRWLWDTRHRLSYGYNVSANQTLTPYTVHQYRPLDERQIELPLMNSGVDRLDDLNRLTPGVAYNWQDGPLRFNSDLSQQISLTQTRLQDKSIREDNWTNPQAGPINWSNRLTQGNLNSLGATVAWRPDRTPDNGSEDLSFYGSNYGPYRFRLDYQFTPPQAAIRFTSDWNLDNDGEDDPVQQVEIAAAVPVTPVFGAFGYANFERPDEPDRLALAETIVGLEYDGCCWHIQLAGQRSVNDEEGESPVSGSFDTIQLNLSLKGLGGLGGDNQIAARMRELLPSFEGRLFNTE